MFLHFFLHKNEVPGKLYRMLYYFILAFIVSIFLKDCPVITNLFMVIILLLACFSVSPKNYFRQFSTNRISTGIVVFFLFHFISSFLASGELAGLSVMVMRLPLFVLSLAFILIDFEEKTWHKILLFYALAATLASIIGFSFGIYQALSTQNIGYLYNDNISGLLFGIQAVYFGFYVNAAVFIFIYLMRQKNDLVLRHRFLIYFLLCWLLFINFMLASKMAMFSLWIILIWMIGTQLIRRKKIFEGTLLLLSVIIGFVIMSKVFPKTLNRFYGLSQTNFQYDNKSKENHFNAAYDEKKWNSTNTRMALWKCGIETWKEHPVFGTGIGTREMALKEKYQEKQFWYALNTNKNLHNQYLDVLVSMGILGLIVFLAVFLIYPLAVFLSKKQSLGISIFTCLAFCFFTENLLDRYQGEVIIALLLPLVSKVFDKEQEPITHDSRLRTS